MQFTIVAETNVSPAGYLAVGQAGRIKDGVILRLDDLTAIVLRDDGDVFSYTGGQFQSCFAEQEATPLPAGTRITLITN